jgi:hypothetical protein|tara:strand:+ start:220 stop:441 length:222 start_codon:yes stop_codon:yes gene_type:complete
MNNRKYIIITNAEVASVDFSQVLETSANTLRYNNAGTKTFVKFDGNTPSFLNGKTQYTHDEILIELSKSDWTE